MIDLPADLTRAGLQSGSAQAIVHRCAVALQRRHTPGVHLTGAVSDETLDEEVHWTPVEGAALFEDIKKVTEEGAEALALALAVRCGGAWTITRRLQQRLGEGADWLLVDESGAEMVLEVSGTDEGDLDARLKAKTQQAKESMYSRTAGGRGIPAACVVRFLEPKAVLWLWKA